MIRNRLISNNIAEIQRKRGRLLLLTGARQTGKTTLLKELFKDYTYLSLEDPLLRVSLQKLSAQEWMTRYPRAILDEVQKLPSLFETIKAAYDESPDVSYILSGSSQVLLLKKVRESLAGRIAICELFPLTLPEMKTFSWSDPVIPSRLVSLIENFSQKKCLDLFQASPLAQPNWGKSQTYWNHYLQWGGMPSVWNETWDDTTKQGWIEDYLNTYLQRDLADLAQLNELEPFVRCQKALASRTGQLINFSDLARLSDISPPTAKRFLNYLEISYQTLALPAYYRNLEKRLSKMPKIHFLDPGICRGLLKRYGEMTGGEFESSVVAEIYKQLKTLRLPVQFHHLRTADGREVDLLVELENGFIGFECKQSVKVAKHDFKHFVGLENYLDKPLLAGFVISQEAECTVWDNKKMFISSPPAFLF